MTYALLRVVAALVALLPRGLRHATGTAVGFLAGSVLRIRRSLVETAMARADVELPRRTAMRMYRALGHGLVDLLWLSRARAPDRSALVAACTIAPEAVSALDEASAHGPVILFASHTGNWEVVAAAAAALLATRGKRLVVVAKAMHAQGVDRFTGELRATLGVVTVPPAGAFASARRALAAGDVVVMPIDQVPDRAAHALELPFLGATALVDRAPATLAWRARATVLVVAATHDGGGARVRLLARIDPPLRGEANARSWIRETMARATTELDAFIRSTPESWLWLHRRWRAPRRAPVAPGLVATGQPG